MRRFRFPLMALLTLIIALLFFCDFFTGRQHLVFQDPYSRVTLVLEQKYGMSLRNEPQSNAMSDYYYNQLKQPLGKHNWQPAPDSYSIERFTWRRVEDTAPIASVIDLKPNDEVYFLCMLPSDKVRLAVIHSLFHERGEGTDPAAQSQKAQWDRVEQERATLIRVWVELSSKDTTTSPARWWHENAKKFGMTPDGDPLPAPKTVTLK